MTKETRKKLGKKYALGIIRGDYEKYYLEFQEEIDNELNPPKIDSTKKGAK